ncbi:MAG TPA: hypothetical protein VHE12_09960 [bacterium]|nr:hypothetical protein [bacterium]
MGYFVLGLGILCLGFGFFQFSTMFSLYRAQKDEDSLPWAYWTLRALGFFSMAGGILIVVYSLMR